jgi:hypothetical protein
MSVGLQYLRSPSRSSGLWLSLAGAIALAGCAKGAEDKVEVDAAPDADLQPDAAPEPDARQEAKSFEVTFRPPLTIPDNDPGGIDVAVVATEVEYTTGLDVEIDVTHLYGGDLRIEVLRGATQLKVIKTEDVDDAAPFVKTTYTVGRLELGDPLNATYNVRFIDTDAAVTGTVNGVKITFKVD